ncbi:MAG TPA: tetratricopeptide repeat protein [Rubrobacter sp.]
MAGGEAMVGSDDRIERAGLLYERAVFGGDAGALATAKRELDGVEADLALARGRIVHARFLEGWDEDPRELALFERAVRLYRMLGDARGEGETLFWVGVFHQVIRHDDGTAVPALKRSLELATQVGDRPTMSYALRHLGIAEHTAGRLEAARRLLEESVRLRREVGFLPGVAANLVGLIYIAAAQGRRDEALATEAAEAAQASGARGLLSQVEEARTRI